MNNTYINYELLRQFDVEGFTQRKPFPWNNLSSFLRPEAFRSLCDDYPPLELFERHNNLPRANGQRPHNRHYLAYGSSIYHESESGVVRHDQLPATWQRFMDELKSSKDYRSFVQSVLGTSNFSPRFAWHVGSQGSEVSPHLDMPEKIGTHILYFNTSSDWKPAWGGQTLVLSGKTTEAMNPDFADFQSFEEAQITDNHSFIFKNTPNAWHGVTALTSPPGSYRRLFNIIFESPTTELTSVMA